MSLGLAHERAAAGAPVAGPGAAAARRRLPRGVAPQPLLRAERALGGAAGGARAPAHGARKEANK